MEKPDRIFTLLVALALAGAFALVVMISHNRVRVTEWQRFDQASACADKQVPVFGPIVFGPVDTDIGSRSGVLVRHASGLDVIYYADCSTEQIGGPRPPEDPWGK